ncbi:MAG: hypothetical protein NTX00_03370 [Candidatus Parcubacteria bacterium]|nr:hypothetical protein [Candidatus Parcubacteria bacterium]
MSNYVCSKCGTEAEVKEMFARPKKAGEETVILCSTCREDEIADAKAQGKDTPVLYPLADSLARDKDHGSRKAEAEARRDQILGRLRDEFLRQADDTIVCVKCGRSHGEIRWYKGGNFRTTVIEKAFPLDFEASDIVVAPVCYDCIHSMIEDEKQLAREEKKETRFLKFHPLAKAYEIVSRANNRKEEKKSWLDRAASGNGRRGHNNNDRKDEVATVQYARGFMKGQELNRAPKTKIGEIVDLTPSPEVPLLRTGTDDEPIDQDRAAREAAAISTEKSGKNRRHGKGK